MVVSFFLLRASVLGGPVAGCGPSGGCGAVLKSQWSRVAGVPVSVFGAAAYGVLLFGALFIAAPTRGFRRLEISVSVAVAAGALWFAGVQAVILRAFCPWCLVAHAAACLGVVLLWRARRLSHAVSWRDPLAPVWAALGLVAVAVLAVGQSVMPDSGRVMSTDVSGAAVDAGGGRISLHGGRLAVDATALPVIGAPGAVVTAVVLTDFTCPHCRELQRVLERVAAERAGRFQAVILPTSHDPSAREIHRLLLAAWRLDAGQYRSLADALVDGSVNPSASEVRDRMLSLFGREFHERAWAEAPWIEDTLRLGESALALNAATNPSAVLPQIMLPDRLLTGSITAEELVAAIDGQAAAPTNATLPVENPAPVTFHPGAPPAPPSSAPAVAAAPAAPVAPSTPGAPVIEFESNTVDLGRVTKGETATRVVRFTNTGGSALTIRNIKAGCGCTTVQGWQQSVEPGQQGSFEIKLDTTNFAGPFIKTIDVETNASNPRHKLDLKADIWSPVKLSAAAVNFGNVIKGSRVEPREIEIVVTEADLLDLGPATSANAYFQAELTPVEPGRRYALKVTVPKLGEQAQHGEVFVRLGHPKLKDIKVNAFINPIDPVAIQPRRIVVPAAALASGTKAIVSVYSHDRQVPDLQVTELSFSGGSSVAVTYEKRPSERWGRIVLAFPAGYVPPVGEKTFLKFKTNHPQSAEVTLPVEFMNPRPAAPAR